MPELPDITVYVQCLEQRVIGEPLQQIRLGGPVVLRTVEPPIEALAGQHVVGVRRLGKRVVCLVTRRAR